MPHPQSSHQPSGRDVFSNDGAISPSKGSFCPPTRLHLQVPLPSPSPRVPGSQSPSAMSTALLERGPFKDQQHPPALMDFDNPSTDWVACDPTSSDSIQNQNSAPYSRYFTPKAAAPFEYIPNGVPYTANYNTTYSSSLGDDPNCSRPYINGFGLSGSMEDMTMAESHPPSAYVIDVPNFPNGIDRLPSQGLQHSQLQQRSREYDHQYYISRGIKLEDHESDFGSPYGSPASTRCSTPFDDLPSPMVTRRDMKVDDGAIDKEQPYAQLIYRALMDAPGNTMILKEIYQWFKDNTDKAADKETKGWQNSIRHNLSMNGAFEKVDQPCEDSRKGFMWRLTDEAIREGVKSTTRFRSKQPNKRGHRSQNPLPQRQASGAKGGQASKRSAKLRRSQRTIEGYARRNKPYMCRSVPMEYNPSGFDPCVDIPIPYPSSPFYGSEIDFSQPPRQDDFGSSLMVPALSIRDGYSTPPLSQDVLTYDNAYVLPQGQPEPFFYDTDTNSPSPPACDEPHTPESQGDCYMGRYPSTEGAYFLDDISADYQG